MMEKYQENDVFILFRQSKLWYFKLFLKKEFSHIFVIKHFGIGWMLIEYKNGYVNANVVSNKYDLINFFMRRSHKIVKLKENTHHKKSNILPSIAFFSCVTLTKYVTKINCKSKTPFAFFNYLIKNNLATEIN
jgi:dolichol kinase